MGEITNVMEFEAIAKQKLPKMVYDYYASGAEDQWTLAENRNAFSRILFRPRILIDVSKIDISTTVLGFKISMPIMVAPTAMQKMAHPDGEYAIARAAAAADTVMTLSSWGTSSVEEVASTGPGVRFFQLYVYKDRNIVIQLVRRAERAGFKAIALTVDTPRLGRREADIKNRFNLPPNLSLKNFEGLDIGKLNKAEDSGLASYVAGQVDRSLSWKDVQWLKTITSLPILVKGVLTAEDARIAVQSGAAGIIVSNHGARQLDYVPATIMALEEVVKAAQGRIPVFLDGGVRRGTDVFKALALGAAGVFRGNNFNQGRRRMHSRSFRAQREDSIRRTVYVSDLDVNVTEEHLAALFSAYGQVVDCRVCGDPHSRLRFAFVEFADEYSAKAALCLCGTILGFSQLKVLPSKTAILPVNPTFLPRSEDEREMCARTVYCTNIDKMVSQADVKFFFETRCGEVSRLRLLGDQVHSTRIGFVEFVMAESAILALDLCGEMLGSQPIRVSPSKTPVRPRVSGPAMH